VIGTAHRAVAHPDAERTAGAARAPREKETLIMTQITVDGVVPGNGGA
jgi:hypothetical protein